MAPRSRHVVRRLARHGIQAEALVEVRRAPVEPVEPGLRIRGEVGVAEQALAELGGQLGTLAEHALGGRLHHIGLGVLRLLQYLEEEAPPEERIGRGRLEQQDRQIPERLVARHAHRAGRERLPAPLGLDLDLAHAGATLERLRLELVVGDAQRLDLYRARLVDALERDSLQDEPRQTSGQTGGIQ